MRKIRAAVLLTALVSAYASMLQAQRAPSGYDRYEEAMAKLRSAESEELRFYSLPDAAMASFEAGYTAEAGRYATELLILAPKYSSNWNYGNAIHKANLVLGRVALNEGDVAGAEQFLLMAGRTPGSPQLNSFGPNMTLAKELLERGRRQSVVSFFELCAAFWELPGDRLELWSRQVSEGAVPDFGPNLRY